MKISDYAVLFKIVQSYKQSKHPSLIEWKNKLWNIDRVRHNSREKRRKKECSPTENANINNLTDILMRKRPDMEVHLLCGSIIMKLENRQSQPMLMEVRFPVNGWRIN